MREREGERGKCQVVAQHSQLFATSVIGGKHHPVPWSEQELGIAMVRTL